MKILAIDTSCNVATVAVCDHEKLISEYSMNHKRTHSQKIMPMVEEILKSCELTIRDIDIFAAANGPGSFTGLRIGVSAVKGFAHAMNKPVVGVSTLEGLAYNLPYCKYRVYPIMDARCSQVYNAVYEWGDYDLAEIISPRALSLEELCGEIVSIGKKVVFLGDASLVYKEALQNVLGELCIFTPSNQLMQKASSIAHAVYKKVNKGETLLYSEFLPKYLRKPQAEREREMKSRHHE